MKQLVAAGCLVALLHGGTSAPAQVNSAVGVLPAGKMVTISFEVTIDSPLPASVTRLSAQGTVTSQEVPSTLSDDPETGAWEDPTWTALFQEFDFGDAPESLNYPTLLANDGARHFVPAGGATLYLGSLGPDTELDGQPDNLSLGDDQAGSDDEDGVVWPVVLPSNQGVSLTVRASGAGLLNAWIDFNQDGDWSDGGEQILVNQSLVQGVNAVGFTTPVIITGGAAFARLRFSSDSGLPPTGLASDGEVEDYQVVLNSPPQAGADTLQRYPSQGVKVLVETLLANDSDADGDALTLATVDSPLPTGATVVRSGSWVFYTPPTGSTAAGSFVYTVNDSHGAASSGLVTVNLLSDNADTRNKISILPVNGAYVITFNGIPGRTYTIQYAESLNPPNTVWTDLGQATANALGIYTYEDRPGSASRYYRSVYP